MPRCRRLVATCLPLAAALLCAGASANDLRVEIHEPTPRAVLPLGSPDVEIVGGASIYGGVRALDLFLVMDTSESLRKTDPEDHRTRGVVALVRSLHPKANIRIGVVDFDRRAQLLLGLTPDRDAVVRALQSLDQSGETNIAAGIQTALAGFDQRGRVGASRVLLLFTDGKSDEKKALAAMAHARVAGVAVHNLLLGRDEEGESLLRQIAQGTDGSFLAVTDPAQLRDAFMNLRTTGVDHVRLHVEGSPPVEAKLVGGVFTGRVPLRPGANRVEAIATSLSGETARTSVTVNVAGDLRVVIATPSQGAEVEPADQGVLVEGLATSWNETVAGPQPPDFDPGIREVWLHVNDAAPLPAQLVGGRFQARVPLRDGDNRLVAVATGVDGRTARDEVTVRLRAPGCAEFSVAALRGNEPAVSLSQRAIEIVIDASNSMWGRMQGEPKISVAKRILADALDWLPEDLALSLRVYGHQHAHAKRHCRDSALLVPLGPDSRAEIRDAIGRFKPRGQTPLAYSLQQIADDFGSFRGERAVVLVTDGIESCDGDPVSAARALQRRGPTPVHVIGFGIGGEDEDDAALRAIARASGGKFLMAHSADELRAALAETAGTPFVVRSGDRVVADGTLGSDERIRLPGGEYTLRLESRPAYEVPIVLESQKGLRLMLKREGRKVFHARRFEPIEYASCELPTAPRSTGSGVVWEELPDADVPASRRR